MAKKRVQRNTNQKRTQTKTRKPATVDTKNRNKSRNKARRDDASCEENEPLVAPSPQNDGEEDRVVDKKEKKKSKGKEEEKKKKNDDAKTKGAKKRSKTEDVESDTEEKIETALYTFPMNRVSRIVRSDCPDIRISQEAVFLINKASEKFLHVFCREAYACSFLEGKSYTAYDHLSSVVAKRKRFGFLSDFVPEKVKSEDALAEIPEGG